MTDVHQQYLKALDGKWLYGIDGVTWSNGYVIKNGKAIEHVSEDYLFTVEGESFIRKITATN